MKSYKRNVLRMEIAYHPEESLTGNRHTPVLHYHTYDNRFSQNRSGPFTRSKALRLTSEMKDAYRKFFKGVNVE